jgi:hypothetical protein
MADGVEFREWVRVAQGIRWTEWMLVILGEY